MDTPALRADPDTGGSAPRTVPWTLWDAAGVFMGWLVLVTLTGAFAALAGVRLERSPVTAAVLLLVSPVAHGILTVLWVRVRSSEGLRRLVGLGRPGPRDAIAGLIHGLVGATLITFVIGTALHALARALGLRIPEVQEPLRDLAISPAAPLAILVIVTVAPIAEELFFRGMLFQALERRFGLWPSALVSAVVFGAVHAEPLVVILTFVLGVYLAVIFRRRGTLVTPMIAHIVFNSFGVLLIRAGIG